MPMIFRTRTSKRTMDIFDAIYQREHLQPFVLVKIAIALAIHSKYKFTGEVTDSNGLDLNRQTITGEYDLLYKKLIECNEGRSLTDEEYFPTCVKAYMDHGAELLEREYKYSKDIYLHLLDLDKGI